MKMAAKSELNSSSGGEDICKALWKLKVEPKIRVFCWRVLKNILPSFGELRRRHVMPEAHCLMCGHDEELLFHVRVKSDHAVLFWAAAQGYFELKLPKLHPSTWSRDILDPMFLSKEKVAIAMSVMWAIWSSSNKYTHKEIKYQPNESMQIMMN